MASVASQLIVEVTAHAQSDKLEDAREICADGTYFLNNLHNSLHMFLCYTAEVCPSVNNKILWVGKECSGQRCLSLYLMQFFVGCVLRSVHTCNVTVYHNAITLQVRDTIRSYELPCLTV